MTGCRHDRPRADAGTDAPAAGRDAIGGFSFVRGGPIHALLGRVGLAPAGLRGAAILSLVLVGFCVLPLLALTALAGTLVRVDGGMPLLGDFATLGRFFLGLPALVLIVPDSDRLLRAALAHFLDAGLIRPADRWIFAGILQDTRRLQSAVWPELLLVASAFLPALLTLGDAALLAPIPGWRLDGDGTLSRAGIWLDFVAKPLWLLIALLWLWRLLLWTILLARLCRMNLALHAGHPDGVGGLGFLPAIQQRFSKFSFAGGVVLAGAAANEIVYRNMSLNDAAWVLAAYLALAMLLLCLPLLVLAPVLASLKRRGMLAYGVLGNAYMQAFEAKWLGGAEQAVTPIQAAQAKALDELGGEYGTLTDLNAAYLIVQRLPIIPVSKWILIGIAFPAILPMIPVALLALGVQDTVRKLMGLLT